MAILFSNKAALTSTFITAYYTNRGNLFHLPWISFPFHLFLFYQNHASASFQNNSRPLLAKQISLFAPLAAGLATCAWTASRKCQTTERFFYYNTTTPAREKKRFQLNTGFYYLEEVKQGESTTSRVCREIQPGTKIDLILDDGRKITSNQVVPPNSEDATYQNVTEQAASDQKAVQILEINIQTNGQPLNGTAILTRNKYMPVTETIPKKTISNTASIYEEARAPLSHSFLIGSLVALAAQSILTTALDNRIIPSRLLQLAATLSQLFLLSKVQWSQFYLKETPLRVATFNISDEQKTNMTIFFEDKTSDIVSKKEGSNEKNSEKSGFFGRSIEYGHQGTQFIPETYFCSSPDYSTYFRGMSVEFKVDHSSDA